jgi:hypothetical protein
MKLVATALSAAFGIASASMDSLQKNIQAAVSARYQNRTGRAFQGQVANGFEPINGYGCWCYLDAEWRDEEKQQINRASILAHGKVVDDMDAACRDLINSYKCIEMDAEKNGIEDCDAQAVPYVEHSFIENADVTADCQLKNPNNECAANACIVEATFILKFDEYLPPAALSITDHPDFNDIYQHDTNNGGPFDPIANCPGIPNPVGSDKECCGDFALLSRHPYRLYSGFTTRSCCNQEVINNELNHCCTDNFGISTITDINEAC